LAEDPEIRERAGLIRFEKKEYRGWKNTCHLSNGTVELTVLTDVGPRIVHYGFSGGENHFHEVDDHVGKTGGAEFRLYGGHRLWAWPEVERTYYPDNRPVSLRETQLGAVFCAPVEGNPPGTHLQRQIELELDSQGAHVKVIHTITNRGREETRLALWAPTVLKPGGRAILPFPPRAAMDKDHFRSVAPLTLWSFTDFTDPRWILGQDFLQLIHDENPGGRFREQMTGLFNSAEWGAYVRGSCVFLKRAEVLGGVQYPDYGCNFEIFTNPEFLELETLGPVVDLRSGESTVHVEHWWLFDGIASVSSEESIRREIIPLIQQTENYRRA
jgi:hypothetical protein